MADTSFEMEIELADGSPEIVMEMEENDGDEVSTTVQQGTVARMPVDKTLSVNNAAADAAVTGNRIRALENSNGNKVNKPFLYPNGAEGQILQTNGDGTTQWVDKESPTTEQITAALMQWLEQNPDARTTLEDGAVSYRKLDQILKNTVDTSVNGGFIEDNSLYLTHDGQVVAGPFTGIGGGGGGGGGGSSNTAIISVDNASGWAAKTVAMGTPVPIYLNWSSLDDNIETGNGTLMVQVNGTTREVRNIPQGTISTDVAPYLIPGDNTIRTIITDSFGNSRTKNFTVAVIALSIESSFDDSIAQTGVLVFPYTPIGEASKTVRFILDGNLFDTVVTGASGRQQTFNFPAQTHGRHTIEVYFTVTLNGASIESNHLFFEAIWLENGNNTPIIASSYNTTEVDQYTVVNIPWMVYNPASQVADVTITVNGDTVSTLQNVDRNQHTFSWRMNETGTKTIVIRSGTASRSFTITVNEVNINVEAETTELALYLSSASRSNNEVDPSEWFFTDEEERTVAAVMSGFNWTSDGWQLDNEGQTALRVSGNARVTIPLQIFATDFRTTGKTIEVEFAAHDVLDYDSVILSCMSGGRGIEMTPQSFRLTSEQSSIGMQFKEEEHVRVGFVVEKNSGYRRIYCYINGILSGVTRYPVDDDFSQVTPVGITIGSNGCAIDLYCIRVYNTDLTSQQIEDNWIADTQDGATMIQRYTHNNVRDAYGNIVIARLPSDLPYFIIECGELPQYKGDKKTCSGSYTDPVNPQKSFTFEGAQIDVQGTSSQYYERKNYKIKFKSGIVNPNGQTVSKYQMRDGAIPVNTFCFKADVASSEGANNVELVRLYNDACPYQTPMQIQDERVRQGIDGFPMVIFWTNTNNNETTFLGKYNFNNDKSTEDVFGFVEGDESWETLNNTSNRVLWKSDDYTSMGVDEDNNVIPAWLNDFEARYPDLDDPYQDPAQLQELATFLKSTDRTAATNDLLPEPETYTATVTTYIEREDPETGTISIEEAKTTQNVTFTNDTAEYRLAKFRNKIGEYVEVQSAMFYYLFTELFLMVDSRAKNSFPSFMGTPIVDEEEEEEEEEVTP